MRSKAIVAFAALFIRLTWAGALQIIDQDGECLIWSNDNHGCTGYSESFAKLNGDDCSEITEKVHGTRRDATTSSVEACGTKDGKGVAWILVNQTGEVTFSNLNGDNSGCILNKGLKAGSWCKATDLKPASATISFQYPSSSPKSSTKLDKEPTSKPGSSSTVMSGSTSTTESNSYSTSASDPTSINSSDSFSTTTSGSTSTTASHFSGSSCS